MPRMQWKRLLAAAKRRETLAGAALLTAGSALWLLGRGEEYPVHENSLESVRFAELGADAGAVGPDGDVRRQTRTAERPVQEPTLDSPGTAGMTAWVISNAALDLNGDFVPPPIQFALAREGQDDAVRPPRREPRTAPAVQIEQLEYQSPAVAPAQFSGSIDDGGEGAGGR